jgi:hypothetical protein
VIGGLARPPIRVPSLGGREDKRGLVVKKGWARKSKSIHGVLRVFCPDRLLSILYALKPSVDRPR